MNTKMKMRTLSFLLCFVMLVGLMPQTVLATNEIHQANITITKPVGGESPDFFPVSSDQGKYYADVDTWEWLTAGSATSVGGGGQFKPHEQYSLRVIFRAKAGYTFADDCVFTINGEATGCYGIDGDEFRYIYWYATDPQNPTYTVHFNADGGKGTMADVTGVFADYELPPCTFTAPAGKFFSGWFVGGYMKDPGESVLIFKNTNVLACWKNIPAPGFGYSVTYNGGAECGGSMVGENKTDFYGELTLPDCGFTPPAGKQFVCWRVGNSNWDPGDKIIIAFDTTVDAVWGDITVGNHPVTIAMKDGDDINSYTTTQYTALLMLVYKGLLVADDQVAGFLNSAGKLLFTMNNEFIVLQEGLTQQDDIRYTLTREEYAAVKAEYGEGISEIHLTFPSKCVVSFETNGGSAVNDVNLYSGDKVTKPADPTKAYYAFAGWYSDSALTQAFDFHTPISGDTTLYAKWTPSPVGGMFLMTIDFNGGTSTMPTVSEVPANSGIYLNDNLGNFVTPPSGKVLAGYEIDGVPYAAGTEYLVTQNFTLKFLWKDAPVTAYTDGWHLISGAWYCYKNGTMLKNTWQLDSVGWCYLGADGAMKTNAWIKDSVGWCYVGANGYIVKNNWVLDGGKWYYLNKDGYMLSNTWQLDSVGWCYLGADGAMKVNSWIKDSVGWCYVGDNGYCVTNAWKKDSFGWVYLNADGRMVTNAWVQDSVGWCYVGANGYCVTNQWKKDSIGWVYLDHNGRMLTNSWVKDSVGWCYVGADGYAVTECWKKDSIGWCYLDENGSMTKSDWVYDGGYWYYLDANGYMVTGTKTIDGKTHKFNSAGIWQA